MFVDFERERTREGREGVGEKGKEKRNIDVRDPTRD